jgi:diguanylate cyclase (GGDEF)-like protein
VIDYDPTASAQTSLHLRRKGMEVIEVSDPLRVLTPLVELQPDLILMDLHMPGCNGMELAATLRQYDSKMRVPIVFLSAESDPLTQFGHMLRVGEDVLDKSIAPQHMVLAVTNHARRSRLLSSLMTRDSLTGLLSHALLLERLDQEIGKVRRQGQPLAFAMADLDGFKLVNDQHGHRAGDRVLRSFGRFVRRELEEGFLVGRDGGDEFGIVLPGFGVAAAVEVLERLRRRFAAIRHSTAAGGVRVTLSIGIADFPRHHELSTLTRAADLALYRAKEKGRNRVAQAI